MPKRFSIKDEIGFFVTVPEGLIERAKEIGTDALCLFVYLRYRTNRLRGEAWPSYDRMTQDLGWGRRRIKNAIDALEAAKALERRKRFGNSTVYVLTYRPPDVGVPDERSIDSRDTELTGSTDIVDSDAVARSEKSRTATPVVPERDLTQDRSTQDLRETKREDLPQNLSKDQTPLAMAKAAILIDLNNGKMYAKKPEIFKLIFEPLRSAGITRDGDRTQFNFTHPDPSLFDDQTRAMLRHALVGVIGGKVDANIFEDKEEA